jgi:hypothetical protein
VLPLQGEEEGSQRKVLVHVLLVVSPVIHMLSVLIVFQKENQKGSLLLKENLVRATREKDSHINYDVHLNVLTVEWGELASSGKVLAIIDTGATENAVGVGSLRFSCSVC